MWEFFKGWRRKIGCITLLMACVLMAGWVRSFYSDDMVYFPRADGRKFLVSGRHGLAWFNESGHLDDDKTENNLRPPITITLDFYQRLNFNDLLEKTDLKLQSSFGGFATFERNYPDEMIDRILVIPYSFIVLPLTALSAFLLLTKPRKSTQEKTTAPATNERGA